MKILVKAVVLCGLVATVYAAGMVGGWLIEDYGAPEWPMAILLWAFSAILGWRVASAVK